ncbi:MAG TPA: RNA methyltransferase [Candidatus Polarisedimenticolia bacterium]|nr:RNA methyltransferase [Candidatus Polarisedimenticolia bacterium]
MTSPPRGHAALVVRSLQHPAVKEARRLETDAAERQKAGLSIAWGRHLALEALRAGVPIARAFVSPALDADTEGRSIASALAAGGARTLLVTSPVLDSIARGAADQGVLLLVRRPSWDLEALLAPKPLLLLAAHGVQDPGNLGTIRRTAQGLGASALLALDGCADPFSSRALRSAMGAAFSFPTPRLDTTAALQALKGAGCVLVAADPGGDRLPSEAPLRDSAAILLGSEGSGLPRDLLAAASARVRIPMAGGGDSLNVAAAAAVLLYEARRQRGDLRL